MSDPRNNTQPAEDAKYSRLYHKTSKEIPSHVTVDLGTSATSTVGGVLSSRMPLGYVDEAGNVVKGFFTQNERLNQSSIFSSRITKYTNNPAYEKYRPILDCFLKTAEKEGIWGTCSQWITKLGVPQKALDDAYDAKRDFNVLASGSGATSGSRKSFALSLIGDDIPANFINAERGKNEFWNYISGILNTAYTAYAMDIVHQRHQKQGRNANINKRNDAMYELAKLAHKEHLIAKSSQMTVLQGGRKIEGTFMVNARGTDSKDWNPRRKEMGNRPLKFTAKAIQDISNIQILDFICGNIDRHGKNLFYELDYSDPEEIKIVGVQGIDNDASFGSPQFQKRQKGFFTTLSDIDYIDADMAEEVLKMKPEDIDAKIRLAGLTREEIDAAHTRLAALQEKIRAKKINIMRGEAAWERFVPEMNNPVVRTGLRKSAESIEYYNTFDNAAFVANRYNENLSLYKRGRFSFQKPSPSAKPPIGISKTSFEYNTVDIHKNELAEVYRQITAPRQDPVTKQKLSLSDATKAFSEKLKDTVNFMQRISARQKREYDALTEAGKEFYTFTLSDKDRNMLAEKLNTLKADAGAYLSRPALQRKDERNFELDCDNYAKNIIAFADFAKESIQKDALEAEKKMASRLSEKVGRELDAARARQTLPALRKTAKDVDSALKKSSRQFKDMVSALNTLDSSKLKTPTDKMIAYRKLADLAQDYIRHKLPPGKKESELSNYEKNRVNFAKDVIGYGQNGQREAELQEKALARQNKMQNAPQQEGKKVEAALK